MTFAEAWGEVGRMVALGAGYVELPLCDVDGCRTPVRTSYTAEAGLVQFSRCATDGGIDAAMAAFERWHVGGARLTPDVLAEKKRRVWVAPEVAAEPVTEHHHYLGYGFGLEERKS